MNIAYSHPLVECEQPCQRMDSSAMLQITHHSDGFPRDRTQLVSNSEDIQKGLCWMFANTVPSILEEFSEMTKSSGQKVGKI